MPASKNALFRYQVLDSCFSDFRCRYDVDRLLEVVNNQLKELAGEEVVVHIRQLRADMNAIRKMLPFDVYLDAIPYDGKKCYYRYSRENFSIYKNGLSADEIKTLQNALHMLKKFRGLPSDAWIEEMTSRLEVRFGVKASANEYISFEQNTRLEGLCFLSPLIDATLLQQPLLVTYQPFNGNVRSLTFHPYFLKQYNNRWFIFGQTAGFSQISNLALDRIIAIKPATCAFIPNTGIDFSTYFDNVVGVSVIQGITGKELETVVLRFSSQRLPYVLSKPIHPSQQLIEENCVALRLFPTKELTQQILAFGSDVVVLSPGWYREEIKNNIDVNLKNYFSVQKQCTDGV